MQLCNVQIHLNNQDLFVNLIKEATGLKKTHFVIDNILTGI